MLIKNIIFLIVCILNLLLYSFITQTFSKPTHSTKSFNNSVKQELNFSNKQDFIDAKKGFIAGFKKNITDVNSNNLIVWDFESYNKFLKETASAPDTANPSLWRIAILNNLNGLFKVTNSIYQIRGADLANMTIVEAPTGLIIIDPLTTPATAKAGLDL